MKLKQHREDVKNLRLIYNRKEMADRYERLIKVVEKQFERLDSIGIVTFFPTEKKILKDAELKEKKSHGR